MAYSILNTLTDICGVHKQEKSIQTSRKKHFMKKNVKECRDVVVKKFWNKVGTLVLHITHMLDL